MRIFLVVLTVIAAVPAGAQETIKDKVKRSGNFELLVRVEYEPATMADLVKSADLVVRVMVQGHRYRLSSDQRKVETDYDAQVLEVIRTRGLPELPPVLVITRPGGTLTIDGYVVKSSEQDFPPFSLGAEYILFLSKTRNVGRFTVAYGAQGAFAIENESTAQMSRYRNAWQAERSEGRPIHVQELVKEIHAAARQDM